MNVGDAIGIGAASISDDLGQDVRAASLGLNAETDAAQPSEPEQREHAH